MEQREILSQAKVWNRRNTLCISRFQTARLGQKIRWAAARHLKSLHKKKGAGRIFSPRFIAPVFALSDHLLLVTQTLSDQADRTLRPFARRRARTLRPLAVAIL